MAKGNGDPVTADPWSFRCNSQGYLILFRGQVVGGWQDVWGRRRAGNALAYQWQAEEEVERCRARHKISPFDPERDWHTKKWFGRAQCRSTT